MAYFSPFIFFIQTFYKTDTICFAGSYWELIIDKKGSSRLRVNGYEYHKNGRSTQENALFWRCSEYLKLGCKSRCLTVNGVLQYRNGKHSQQEHNH